MFGHVFVVILLISHAFGVISSAERERLFQIATPSPLWSDCEKNWREEQLDKLRGPSSLNHTRCAVATKCVASFQDLSNLVAGLEFLAVNRWCFVPLSEGEKLALEGALASGGHDLLLLAAGIRGAELRGIGTNETVANALRSVMLLRDDQTGVWKGRADSSSGGSPVMAAVALKAIASAMRQGVELQGGTLLLQRFLSDLIWHAEDGGDAARFFRDAQLGVVGASTVVLDAMLDLHNVSVAKNMSVDSSKLAELIGCMTTFFVSHLRERQPVKSTSIFFNLFGLHLLSRNHVRVHVFAQFDRSIMSLLDTDTAMRLCMVTAFGTTPDVVHQVVLVHVLSSSGKISLLGTEELVRNGQTPEQQCFDLDLRKSGPVAGSYAAKIRVIGAGRVVLETTLPLTVVTRIDVTNVEITQQERDCTAKVEFKVKDLATGWFTSHCSHVRVVVDDDPRSMAVFNESARVFAVRNVAGPGVLSVVVTDQFVEGGGLVRRIGEIRCAKEQTNQQTVLQIQRTSSARKWIWESVVLMLSVASALYSNSNWKMKFSCVAIGMLPFISRLLKSN